MTTIIYPASVIADLARYLGCIINTCGFDGDGRKVLVQAKPDALTFAATQALMACLPTGMVAFEQDKDDNDGL